MDKTELNSLFIAIAIMIIFVIMWFIPMVYFSNRVNDIEAKIDEALEKKPRIIYVTPEEPPEEALEKSVNYHEGSDSE